MQAVSRLGMRLGAPARFPRPFNPTLHRPYNSLVRRAKSLYEAYDGLLQRHRLATTTATGTILAFAGDLCTQTATQQNGLDDFDMHRGLSFALFGGAVTGPVNYFWLNKLDTLVRAIAPQGGWMAVGCKLTIQTFFFQPLVYVPLFFSFSAVFRGWSLAIAQERVRAEYARTVKSLWGFWTPICVFAFGVLPVRQQAIFFSAISLAWNAILSFLANQEIAAEAPLRVEAAPEQDASGVVRRTSSGRPYLPDYQPPMGILDNDPNPPPRRGPTDQSVIGFLLGPGLM